MARRLVELATQPKAAKTMGEAGCARVKAKFSMQAMVDTYQNVYDTALRQRSPALAISR